MSAILFNQEPQAQQLNTDATNQLGDDDAFTTAASTFTNMADNANTTAAVLCTDDVCEELLDNKMAALELNEVAVLRHQHTYDGSDSGVDIASTMNVTLQRALSSNSGGYSSSNGGLDETTQGFNNMSCDSSMLSCASDLYEIKANGINATAAIRVTASSYECCSENGSESSSVTGSNAAVTEMRKCNGSVKKRVAMFEPGTPPSSGTSTVKTVKETVKVSSTTATAGQLSSVSQVRSRLNTGLKRASSLSRPSLVGTSAQQARERSNEKQTSNSGKSATTIMSTSFRATPTRTLSKPQKPDSLPNALSRTQSASMQRLLQRTPSLSRTRTPGTPSDDGRWPAVSTVTGSGNARSAAAAAAKRGMSVTPDLMSLKMRSNVMGVCMEAKHLNSNPYSTLPRRRKQKSVEDLTGRGSRSSSISRDSRMSCSVVLSASRKNLVSSFGTVAGISTQTKMLPPANKSFSARKPQQTKTRIYHEISVQTALTSDDIEKAFAGSIATPRSVEAAEQRDQQAQTDIRDRELERLQDEVRQLAQREHELSAKLQREREEKLTMQRELHLNTERVMGMLEMARIAGGGGSGTPTSDDGAHDSLLMLESQIQMSGHEIGHLRQFCRSLQLEMQRSLTAQECLLQEKAAIEQESSELHDFLQHEKTAMCEALKELEVEYQTCKQQLSSRDEEIKVLRDECRHLVRLNEQRRQENRLLQTKYAALETKSKELILQQNYSVSGASAALSGLHTRLDSLVEQLVTSYNISEQDLEDIGFQNETQTSNGSSFGCDATSVHDCEAHLMKTNANAGLDMFGQLTEMSDGSLSPQRNQSFIAAVISAIRNATTPAGKKLLARHASGSGNGGPHVANTGIAAGKRLSGQQYSNHNNHNEHASNGDDSDSTEMLDSETEPCLMMDNVLEDVTMPDSHSHNMVSSCTGMISQIDIPSELINVTTADESLHNLSQAIVNRQQMELQLNAMNAQKVAALQLNQHDNSVSEDISCHDSVAEMPSLAEYCSAQGVVDQIIELDSLVTKLLKVLRLIQMDNDNCIQQLIVDKNKLQQNKEDMLEKLKDLEDVNIKLQDELMDATQELMLKNSDLSSNKAEIQRHRNEIDRLTEDICNLSTLCSNYKKLSPTTEFVPIVGSNSSALNNAAITTADNNVDDDEKQNDITGILNLLRMWQADGQLKDNRILSFLNSFCKHNKTNSNTQDNKNSCINDERVRIYANQLENVLEVLATFEDNFVQEHANLLQLRKDIEIVKLNANWTHVLGSSTELAKSSAICSMPNAADDDIVNANNANVAATQHQMNTNATHILEAN